jgi:hypothetical protein
MRVLGTRVVLGAYEQPLLLHSGLGKIEVFIRYAGWTQ